MNSPRIAAVDVGTRRVGVSLADPLGLFAQPVGAYPPGEALRVLARLHEEHGLSVVVVGWPLDEDGREGAAVLRTKPFAGRVRALLPGVQVETYDETGSSKRATEALVAAGVRKGARRAPGRRDSAAACIILTDYLADRDDGPGRG